MFDSENQELIKFIIIPVKHLLLLKEKNIIWYGNLLKPEKIHIQCKQETKVFLKGHAHRNLIMCLKYNTSLAILYAAALTIIYCVLFYLVRSCFCQ